MENSEASLTATFKQLAREITVLNELNENLLAIITDPDKLEAEIMQAEDIECETNETSAQISAFILSNESVKSSETLQVTAPPTSITTIRCPPSYSTSQPQATTLQSTMSPTFQGNI
jgi:hypothetical protein